MHWLKGQKNIRQVNENIIMNLLTVPGEGLYRVVLQCLLEKREKSSH